MRIAIAGGTGFVGRHLARALLAQGHSVFLMARGADQRQPEIRNLLRVTFMSADLSDVSELERAPEDQFVQGQFERIAQLSAAKHPYNHDTVGGNQDSSLRLTIADLPAWYGF